MKIKACIILLFTILGPHCIKAQCSATTTPHYEGFQNITTNNQLPPCWAATNLSTSCLTFTPPGEAAFSYSPGTTDYFFSRGFQLNPNAVYRVTLYYKLSSAGSNWGNVSIYAATAQATTGLSLMAISPAIITNTNYVALSGTFAVTSPTAIFFAISAVCNSTTGAQYLKWDDFQIITPCNLVPNSPTISIAANPTVLCNAPGAQCTLTASGASNYTWTGGAQGPTIIATSASSSYMVSGSNSLTGCMSNANKFISFNPVPNLAANLIPNPVCSGATFALTGYGANSYTWSNGNTTSSFTQSINTPETFTLTGKNSAGCTSTIAFMVPVTPSPTILLVASSQTICAGDQATLTASGGTAYFWDIPQGAILGNQVYTNPGQSSVYSVTIKDGYCSGTATLQLNVTECTGINELTNKFSDEVAFPNPVSDLLHLPGQPGTRYVLFDNLGTSVLQFELNNGQLIDLSSLSAGVYFLWHKDVFDAVPIRIVKE